MRRLALSAVLSTGMLVIGCPRPGAPFDGSSNGGSGGSTTTQTSSSDTGGSTGGTGPCTLGSCMDAVIFVPISQAGEDYGRDVRVASDGSALVTGGQSVLPGDLDAFAMRVGADGVQQWTSVIHQNGKAQEGRAIAESGAFLFVAGSGALTGADTDMDGFVAQLTSQGSAGPTEAIFHSVAFDQVTHLAADGPDGVFAVGSLGAPAVGPSDWPPMFGTEDDIFLTHLAQSGLASWDVLLDVTTTDLPTIVGGYARNPDKNLSFLGLTLRSTVLAPKSDNTIETIAPGVMGDPADTAVLVLDETLPATACMTKAFRIASSLQDTIDAVAADADPDWVYVAGTYTGEGLAIEGTLVGDGAMAEGVDVFIAKLSTNDGHAAWVRRFHGPGDNKVGALAFSSSGVYFAGTFTEDGTEFDDPNAANGLAVNHTAGVDFVVVRLDRSTGAPTLLNVSEGAGDEWPGAMAVDEGAVSGSKAYWITGDFTGDLAFAGKTAAADGSFDGFLFRVGL
ncbi:MAG: hypothetical protein U0441_12490 [Polyangiaceae bacterium]